MYLLYRFNYAEKYSKDYLDLTGVYIWNVIQDHIPINTSYSKFKSSTKNYFLGKISTSQKNSYPLPPPCENCLTITETTSDNQTKSQPLPKNPHPS